MPFVFLCSPQEVWCYSTRVPSLSSSEQAFGDSLVVSEVQSGYAIIGEGEVHTGLYMGLDGLYGGESGGASGTESSRRLLFRFIRDVRHQLKSAFLVQYNVLVVQKDSSIVLVFRARRSDV